MEIVRTPNSMNAMAANPTVQATTLVCDSPLHTQRFVKGGSMKPSSLRAFWDAELKVTFKPVAEKLTGAEKTIASELIAVQGKPVDIGGYYKPDDAKTSAVMRPSATFN